MNEICFSSEIDRTALTEKGECFQESSQQNFREKSSWQVLLVFLTHNFSLNSGALNPHVLHDIYNEYGNELLASNDTEQPVGNSTK